MSGPSLIAPERPNETQTSPIAWTLSDREVDVARPRDTAPIVQPQEETLAVLLVTDFFYELAQADGEYVASEPMTGMYGEGDDPSSAVVSLLHSLATLREELRSHGDRLAPELKADLDFLNRILWV